jgi:hypothetical protein
MIIAALAKRPVTAQARNVFVHIGLLPNLRLCLLNSTRISQLTDLGRHFDDHRDGHAKANQAECN